MSDLTDYTEQVFRDWMSQGTSAPTPPDPLYIALHTADPGETPDGTTEVSASNYSRESLGSSNWGTLTQNNAHAFQNATDVTYQVASSNWGTISHVSLWDGSSDTDNSLASFALNNSKTIESDDQVKFPSGNLTFEIA